MKDLTTISWTEIYQSINETGYAVVPSVLSDRECEWFRSSYSEDALYRSTINMQRYRFGKGEYRYFNYPLPEIIQSIRENPSIPLWQFSQMNG